MAHKTIQIPFVGSLNIDDPLEVIPPGVHTDARNIIWRGNPGNMRAENVPGTRLIFDPSCVAVNILGHPSLPDGIIGEPYEYEFNITGSPEFTLENVVKPDWLTIVIEGFTVILNGTPEGTAPDIAYGLNGNLKFSAVNYSNASFRAAIESIPAPIIRYPGGSNANTFDWQNGRDENFPYGTVNSLTDLATFVSESGCDVTFVLNICSRDIADQIDMLDTANGLGIPIKYVELGNEINIEGSVGNLVYPTADAYADAMVDWQDAIHAAYPDAKVAWVAENKPWSPTWTDIIAAKNPDALVWHEGPHPEDFIVDGEVSLTLIDAIIQNDFELAGFVDIGIPVWCSELNYKLNEMDPPLTEQQKYDVVLYMLRKITSLLSDGDVSKQKIMCVRGVVGNQAAVNDVTFALEASGLALQDFLAEGDLVGTEAVGFDIINCGGSVSFSDHIRLEDSCVKVSIVGTPDLPDVVGGIEYDYTINLHGTQPFSIGNITKPYWMTITVVDDTIVFGGTPAVDDTGTSDVSFDISNCGGTIPFADTVTVLPTDIAVCTQGFSETVGVQIFIQCHASAIVTVDVLCAVIVHTNYADYSFDRTLVAGTDQSVAGKLQYGGDHADEIMVGAEIDSFTPATQGDQTFGDIGLCS